MYHYFRICSISRPIDSSLVSSSVKAANSRPIDKLLSFLPTGKVKLGKLVDDVISAFLMLKKKVFLFSPWNSTSFNPDSRAVHRVEGKISKSIF